MINYFFLLLLLIYPIFSGYQPLKKYNGFDKLNDNICKYTYADVDYVKMCKDGQHCESVNHGLSMCLDARNQIKKKVLNEPCSFNEECEGNLYCDYKCTMYCPSNGIIVKQDDGDYGCKNEDIPAGLYYYVEYNDNFISTKTRNNPIEYGKVGGIISYKKDDDNIYHITKKENAFIGTVKDGEFVENSLACQSGYALLFYLDGSLKDPRKSTANTINQKKLKCVTVKEVGFDQEGNCYVKYDNDQIYYSAPSCNEFLMKKLELFKKYTEKFTAEKQESCAANKENYNEPETCNDDEIRKWKYFYDNPEHYMLYYEKEDKVNDVVNYLIQKTYKEYQYSGFLKFKYLFLLFSLLLI